MADNPAPSKPGIGHKIIGLIEEHPIIVAGIVAGAVLGITILLRGGISTNGTASNQVPYVATDAAGNPIDPYTGQALSGAQVAPAMSSQDLATLLQNMEQQIVNWENSYVPPSSNNGTGSGSGSGNTSGGNNSGSGSSNSSGNDSSSSSNSGSGSPPKIPWWKHFLTTNPYNVADASAQSWYKITTPETMNQLATLFGINWTGIAYNPHNAALLHQAYLNKGNETLPSSTMVWIPTSTLRD